MTSRHRAACAPGRRRRRPRSSRISASSARHSTASAPCPTWGSMSEGSRTPATLCGEAEPLESRHRHHPCPDRLCPLDAPWRCSPAARRRSGPAGARQAAPCDEGMPVATVAPGARSSSPACQPWRHGGRPVRGRSRSQARRPRPKAGPSPSGRRYRPTFEHRLLYLLHEHTLAAERRHRLGGFDVPPGSHHDELERSFEFVAPAAMRGEDRADALGLKERKRRAACRRCAGCRAQSAHHRPALKVEQGANCLDEPLAAWGSRRFFECNGRLMEQLRRARRGSPRPPAATDRRVRSFARLLIRSSSWRLSSSIVPLSWATEGPPPRGPSRPAL